MSSAGINAINSGPLNIRTYNNSLNNTTYILGNYDIPVSSNLVLITSTNGLLAPSNSIYISSIGVSSLVASTIDVTYAKISTLVAVDAVISTLIVADVIISTSITTDATIFKTYLSTVSSIGEDIIFTAPVKFDTLVTAPFVHFSTISSISSAVTFTAPLIAPVVHFSTVSSIGGEVTFTAPIIAPVSHFSTVSSISNGVTFTAPVVLTEPGAETDITSANLTIWGKASGDPINESFTTTTTYTIQSTISTVNFQLIGAGGNNTFSNPSISTEQLPGYGAYISGTLRVKQGDSLVFTIGQLGSGSSGGTSLIYISTTGGTPVSTLVCIAGAGGGNGYAPDSVSTSSGGGHGGGGSGSINIGGLTDYIAKGTLGYDGFSSINGILESVVDGGQGGQLTTGGSGGGDGLSGQNRLPFGTFTDGGIVLGGQGGLGGAAKGGWGGAGYNGGGGGGSYVSGTISTSAGGGGGATYIATSTLSEYLLNIVCLGGEFLHNNNTAPFGGNYGLPINPGYAYITAYSPNDTLYTNGDIQCRVLKYSQLDPPINSFGGVAALWSLYPAINLVNMNDNAITECGGLEISNNGMDVTGLTNIKGSTIITGPAFYYSSINPTLEGTFKVDLDGANLLAYKSSIGGSATTVVQNTGGGRLVLGTSNPSIYINGTYEGNNFVGINKSNPIYELDISGNLTINNEARLPYISSNIISSGTIYSGIVSTHNISSGIGYFNTLSSNIISSGTIYSGTVSTHNISSGIGYFNTLSSNTYIRGVNNALVVSNNSSFPLITNFDGNVGINIDKGASNNQLGLTLFTYNSGIISTITLKNTGNVGIGTDTPDTKLDVSGSVQITAPGSITNSNFGVNQNTLVLNSGVSNASTGSTSIIFKGTTGNQAYARIYAVDETVISGGYRSKFGIQTGFSTQLVDRLTIISSGNIGIGTTLPEYNLDVIGVTRISSLLISSISTLQPEITISATNVSTIGNASITGDLTVNDTIYSAALSSNTISTGIGYFGTLSSNTILTGIGYFGTLSSNTISTGIGYFRTLSSNTISTGIGYFGTLSSNTISTGIGYFGTLSSNTISSSTGLFTTLSSNIISTGIYIIGNYLSTNTINMSTGQINGLSTINGRVQIIGPGSISTAISSFGVDYDTLTLNSGVNVYSTGITSVVFTGTTPNQAYARIYGLDESIGPGGGFRSKFGIQTGFSTRLIDRLTIISSGNIGIGTTTPQYNLDVIGDTRISSLIVSSITTLQPQITISATNVSTIGNASMTGTVTANNIALSVYTSSVGLLQYVPLAWMIDGVTPREPMFYTGNGVYKNFLFPNVDNQYLIGPRISTIIYDGPGGGGVITASYSNPSYTDWFLAIVGATDRGESYSLYTF